jgi:cytochrome c oxidase subunit 2
MLAALAAAGCQQARSILAPVTPEADGIARIWWVFFAVCTVIYMVIVGIVVALALKSRTALEELPPPALAVEAPAERRVHRAVKWATAGTGVILLALLTADLCVQRGLTSKVDNPLTIRLIGHQWWWSAEYQSPNAAEVFETANELHVPTGRPIRLILESSDVIHSFWVPRLHGKRDLVPGHPAVISFSLDSPGRFEGQCAEFCGYQHAHMGLSVTAEAPAEFEAWARAQRTEAATPQTDSQRRGHDLFQRTTCAMCHTINGTMAHSRVGPSLTHVATRRTLGAGVAANTRERLAIWISNPHALKPGVLMPPNEFSSSDLASLLDYLEILK